MAVWVGTVLALAAAGTAGGATECTDGVVHVKARDPHFVGQYDEAGSWGGRPFYQGPGSRVLYYAGDRWILGTTLGVRHLQNRLFASRVGSDLLSAGMWKSEASARADPAIQVQCGGATPRVLQRDVAETVALFKTGPDRHLHNFLGVYRVTERESQGHPVYQLSDNDYFLSFNDQKQWIIGREHEVGSTSGFAFIALTTDVAIQAVNIPKHGVWQIADQAHQWHEHADLKIARGGGGRVRIEGRVGSNEHINGEYTTVEQVCNNRFVYEKENGRHVLYFLDESQQWHVSSADDVCTDKCWAYVTAGTDAAIDDPEHAFGDWHVHSGNAGFVVDPNIRLHRVA